jgi:hypothetical protein
MFFFISSFKKQEVEVDVFCLSSFNLQGMTVDGLSLSRFNKRAIGSMFSALVSQNAARCV